VKIALVIKDFSGRRGGGEGYAFRLALELARLGHEIHVYANSWDKPEEEGLFYHRVPMVRRSSMLKLISFPRNAGRLLKEGRFDVINGLTQVLEQDVFRLGGGVAKHWLDVRARFSPFPFLIRMRPLNLINLFIERRIFTGGRCRRFIVNSKLCRGHLKKYYGVPGDRIDLVYNGVDTERFNPEVVRRHRAEMRAALGVKDDEMLVLTASSNPKRKGLGSIIAALAALGRRGEKSSSWQWGVTGSPPSGGGRRRSALERGSFSRDGLVESSAATVPRTSLSCPPCTTRSRTSAWRPSRRASR